MDQRGPDAVTGTRRRVWASTSPGRTVVRYADGRVLKGYSWDCDPKKPSFHLVAAEDRAGAGTEVWVKDLKAVFFVRSFEANPQYTE